MELKVLIMGLGMYGPARRCLIQLEKDLEGVPGEGPQLFEVKDTELNQFLENPLQNYLESFFKNKYNPILEHLGKKIESVVFSEAKLIKISKGNGNEDCKKVCGGCRDGN